MLQLFMIKTLKSRNYNNFCKAYLFFLLDELKKTNKS